MQLLNTLDISSQVSLSGWNVIRGAHKWQPGQKWLSSQRLFDEANALFSPLASLKITLKQESHSVWDQSPAAMT